MARVQHWGCEISTDEANLSPNISSVTRDTTTFRSGAASFKFDSTGVNQTAFETILGLSLTASLTYYHRMYVNFSSFPSGATRIMAPGGSGAGVDVRVTSGGSVGLYQAAANTLIGSGSSALSTGVWYRVEVKYVLDGTFHTTDAELRIDGATISTVSGLALATASGYEFGWIDTPGASKVFNGDDYAINDSSGAANNSWCGDGKVIVMKPSSDNAIGAFVAGAGGTTNLWDAVNNMPPVGVAEASATNTSQIKNRSATNPTNYDANLPTYTAAGVGASDTVNAIQIWCVTGEDPATGTKVGAVAGVSNPVISAASFNYGADIGLQGTYLGNWVWQATAVAQAPSVTKGTAPVIRLTCTSGATSARSASCCFLGAYVDYTPAAPAGRPISPIVSREASRRRVRQYG